MVRRSARRVATRDFTRENHDGVARRVITGSRNKVSARNIKERSALVIKRSPIPFVRGIKNGCCCCRRRRETEYNICEISLFPLEIEITSSAFASRSSLSLLPRFRYTLARLLLADEVEKKLVPHAH
ncbi:hypothetical protein QLX08_007987 [Tetragonisca angustula]|uniref:Uncharacterized protein n=1 Tax=Tetragonisca angustula TaxID=166442 RepID=A0AAW0ZQ88_9HYME